MSKCFFYILSLVIFIIQYWIVHSKPCRSNKLLGYSRSFLCAGAYESLGPCQAVTIYGKFQLKCYICRWQTRYLSRQTVYASEVTKIPLKIQLGAGFSPRCITNAILLDGNFTYRVLRSQIGHHFNQQVTLFLR